MIICRKYRLFKMLLPLLMCTGANLAHTQTPVFFKSFTVADGLPSNLVYSAVQDDKGFLWIGTDNGVSRFDGKYFKNYTLTDGVLDNDVLEVIKEKDGTIWINTFKQGPCYYDAKSDRFVDPLKDSKLPRDFVKLVLSAKALSSGGIVFFNGSGQLVFKNRKLVEAEPDIQSVVNNGGRSYKMFANIIENNGRQQYAYLIDDNKRDSLFLFLKNDAKPLYGPSMLFEDKLYVLRGNNSMTILKRAADGRKLFEV